MSNPDLDKASGHLDHVTPSVETIERSRSSLISRLPIHGLGDDAVQAHLTQVVAPALNRASQSPNYYGFVTGGATPAAIFADNLATTYDQNVGVHLPNETIATDVEDAALRMICDFSRLPEEQWLHRTFTTGATASNVLGVACGREYVVRRRAERQNLSTSVAEHGIVEAMRAAKLDEIQILTTVPHSSLRKAAALAGLGRACIKDVGLATSSHQFDLSALEAALGSPRTASIVAVSCAEVNTGFFATSGDDMRKIRELCDKHGAWLHIDAAFGLQARILPADDSNYQSIAQGVAGIELADSITSDAHKLLNVPYDCGIFLSRHLNIGTDVFQNPNAAYLNAGSTSSNSHVRVIPSPLNVGIENSRRFRALPVYSTLASLGRTGYREILSRQIELSRAIARFILDEPRLQLLPRRQQHDSDEDMVSRVYVIVLFRATDDIVNQDLVRRINASRRIYVSGTSWDGRPAARFAVANWQADVPRDLAKIKEVLREAVQ